MTSGVFYDLMLLRLTGLLVICVIAGPQTVPRLIAPPGVPVSSGGSMPISPAVMATSFGTQLAGDPVRLQLLVLWRGTPGWFLEGGGSRGGSGGGSRSVRSETLKYGGLWLTVSHDSIKRIAHIQDKPVDLQDDNVIFVDDVDAPAGPRVTGTMRLGPDMTGTAVQLGDLLSPSPRVVEFLRCDAKSPSGRGQAMLDSLCARMLGIVRPPK